MRSASTYRGARRNATFRPKTGKGTVWKGIKTKYHNPPPVRLNRSQHWVPASSYEDARYKCPLPGLKVVR